jgi:Delta7-sterol 5-desaturase
MRELLEKGTTIFTISTIRYVVFAGLAYLLFYVVFKNNWLHKRIQQKFPGKDNIFYEIKYSMLNMVIFGITGMFTVWASNHGWTQIYLKIQDYGIAYFIFSVIAMIIVHDTYFYWTHRFMHLKKVFPLVHKVHHHSLNPTPWAAFYRSRCSSFNCFSFSGASTCYFSLSAIYDCAECAGSFGF